MLFRSRVFYVLRFSVVLVAGDYAVLIISIPFKVKFMKWWSKRQREKKGPRGKWGDDE